MKDTEFSELQLKATIVPQQARWPSDVLHWQKLHEVVDEARNRVAQAWAAMDDIERDRDLSPEGKDRQRKKLAAKAIADFEESKMLAEARNAVDRVVALWQEKMGVAIKPAATMAEAVVHAQVRDRLAAMKGKMSWLEKHGTNPVIASAILTAPAFLSGLNDTEIALVKCKVEQHVAPEIAQAKAESMKALEAAEKGWAKALDRIGQRAGLTKGQDGVWRDPSVPEAA